MILLLILSLMLISSVFIIVHANRLSARYDSKLKKQVVEQEVKEPAQKVELINNAPLAEAM